MSELNRRDFLQGMGVVGAGAVLLGQTAGAMGRDAAPAAPVQPAPIAPVSSPEPRPRMPEATGKTLKVTEEIPVRNGVDVIVAGGGVAGVAAALAARRAGKDVLLLEKTTLMGGLATIGLINYFEPLCNGRGKQVIFGMCEEFLRLAMQVGWYRVPKEWVAGQPKEPTEARYTCHYSPNIFALQLLELIHKEGVQIMLDCIASRPIMDGTHCKGLVVDSKSGREFIPAKVVIDTTGDCDILYRAGMPTVQGRNFFTYWTKAITVTSCKRAANSGNIRDAFTGRRGGESALSGKGHPEGMPVFQGTTVDNVTDYLLKNELLLLERLKKEKQGTVDVVTLPTMAQFRETRCLDGDHAFVNTDKYRHYADSIASICDFTRRDAVYDVPYGTLCRHGWDNLLTAGRTASAKGFGWDVLRVIPPAIMTGEAAGFAAALAIDSRKGVTDIDISALQKILVSHQAPVHFDDALIPANAK